MNKWTMESFTKIGEACGGLTDIAKKTLNHMDFMEARIKVKGNNFGFLPAQVLISDATSSKPELKVSIEPFFIEEYHTIYKVGVHGGNRGSPAGKDSAEQSKPPTKPVETGAYPEAINESTIHTLPPYSAPAPFCPVISPPSSPFPILPASIQPSSTITHHRSDMAQPNLPSPFLGPDPSNHLIVSSTSPSLLSLQPTSPQPTTLSKPIIINQAVSHFIPGTISTNPLPEPETELDTDFYISSPPPSPTNLLPPPPPYYPPPEQEITLPPPPLDAPCVGFLPPSSIDGPSFNPQPFLKALGPWLEDCGLCLTALPAKKNNKKQSVKRTRAIREIKNLQSSISYEKKSTNLFIEGSFSPTC